MNALQKEAHALIDTLSGKKLKEAHDFLHFLNDIDSESATVELINLDILKDISNGIKQIHGGEFVKFSEIRKNV